MTRLADIAPGLASNEGSRPGEGNMSGVLRAAVDAIRGDGDATLAVVLETEGSTYARAGTLALFTSHGHVGWISGGCLEPEIERRALSAATTGRIEWLEIDTRDDEAMFAGAATGCRGRQRLALLPLRKLAGVAAIFDAWLDGQRTLLITVGTDGRVRMETTTAAGTQDTTTRGDWQPGSTPVGWEVGPGQWTCTVRRPPQALLLGAGPEAPMLVPMLRDLGWHVAVVERRPRWRAAAAGIGPCIDADATQALASTPTPDAALVMHHNFELDRDALDVLAGSAVPFIGLLGPPRRRDDLARLLPANQLARLQPRLHAPVGLWLGGRGPEAIALSIAAQLQSWRHSVEA